MNAHTLNTLVQLACTPGAALFAVAGLIVGNIVRYARAFFGG